MGLSVRLPVAATERPESESGPCVQPGVKRTAQVNVTLSPGELLVDGSAFRLFVAFSTHWSACSVAPPGSPSSLGADSASRGASHKPNAIRTIPRRHATDSLNTIVFTSGTPADSPAREGEQAEHESGELQPRGQCGTRSLADFPGGPLRSRHDLPSDRGLGSHNHPGDGSPPSLPSVRIEYALPYTGRPFLLGFRPGRATSVGLPNASLGYEGREVGGPQAQPVPCQPDVR